MRLHFDWWPLNRGGTGAPDDGDEFVMVKITMMAACRGVALTVDVS